MRRYGLTGGIASGKSTVSTHLRALGAHVLDADVLAREVVAPGSPGLTEVLDAFPFARGADGGLDRKALGAFVFQHPDARATLNQLLHPRIQQAFAAKTQALEAQGVTEIVYDAPLLIENGLHRGMDAVILVAVDPEVQVARLMARDGLSRADAAARLRSQLPLEEKRRYASHVVDNSGTVEETRGQVERIWRSLRGGA